MSMQSKSIMSKLIEIIVKIHKNSTMQIEIQRAENYQSKRTHSNSMTY